jgi:hypothetical protein
MQKKTEVAACLLLCTMMLISGHAFAQAAQSSAGGDHAKALDQDIQMLRQNVRDGRKQITAANLTLTTDEATKFWPIYDQYVQESAKIDDARVALIKDYAMNYDKMTDQLAQDLVKKETSIDQQHIALRDKYVPIFGKVISGQKTALWYQIDRRLDLLINLQLAESVPVIYPTK